MGKELEHQVELAVDKAYAKPQAGELDQARIREDLAQFLRQGLSVELAKERALVAAQERNPEFTPRPSPPPRAPMVWSPDVPSHR
jgi:hypothetical protein